MLQLQPALCSVHTTQHICLLVLWLPAAVNWPAIAVWTRCSHCLASRLMTNCLWLVPAFIREWQHFNSWESGNEKGRESRLPGIREPGNENTRHLAPTSPTVHTAGVNYRSRCLWRFLCCLVAFPDPDPSVWLHGSRALGTWPHIPPVSPSVQPAGRGGLAAARGPADIASNNNKAVKDNQTNRCRTELYSRTQRSSFGTPHIALAHQTVHKV